MDSWKRDPESLLKEDREEWWKGSRGEGELITRKGIEQIINKWLFGSLKVEIVFKVGRFY